ncbi:spermidine synthase [Kibdelosporangium philippinense]|uniref:Polyamine aminopropyltransferase n=1 Tax=Kibdelosporangium philippinense TaxID=211113 RepID=A0ABS8Z1P8_9PSEU|nr:spermidine synthase [Kibdelosporangium philippinense]MCE7001282.1 spermidine synthase [Kibdelosporangium philippinense]
MRIEEPVGAGLTRVWQVDEVLVDTKTEFQHLVIGKTAQGVSLFCDNERQSTDFSQLVYHEALMVPAFLLAAQVDRVLIVGSSEGVASQMAVEAGATVVDHVDIDTQAVKLCAEHLPYGYTLDELEAAEKGDGPIRVLYADGYEFIRTTEEKYDIVVVDLPDEQDDHDAQQNRLYGAEFLSMCKRLLAPGGVVAYQGGCPTLWRNGTLIKCWRRFEEVFSAPVYFGSDEHEWAFFFGTSQENEMVSRLPSSKYRPKTIDALTLQGSTVPPISLR